MALSTMTVRSRLLTGKTKKQERWRVTHAHCEDGSKELKAKSFNEQAKDVQSRPCPDYILHEGTHRI